MYVTFECQRQTVNTSQKLSVKLRAVTTSGRVGMRGTGQVFCVVSILLRYKSRPNLFTVARRLAIVMTGDASPSAYLLKITREHYTINSKVHALSSFAGK